MKGGTGGVVVELLPVVSEEEIHALYAWIDGIPLSRPKRNISRDFSDGVLLAEVLRHFYPKIVDIHNYVATSNFQGKVSNWNLLNKKVLARLLGGAIGARDVEDCAGAVPGAIEKVLNFIKPRLPSLPNQLLLPPAFAARDAERSPGNAGKEQQPQAKANTETASTEELQAVIANLQERVGKLEQLVQIKDLKIKTLQDKLHDLGVNIRKP